MPTAINYNYVLMNRRVTLLPELSQGKIIDNIGHRGCRHEESNRRTKKVILLYFPLSTSQVLNDVRVCFQESTVIREAELGEKRTTLIN